jgi:arylsulfatase A-like enzyme
MYDGRVDFDDFTLDYAETLRAVDDSVGAVVDALRRRGILESTLLVFTSDKGFQFGEHGLIDKRTMYEESIRVPLIVHCPELIEGGTRRTELITNLDFAPTFMELAASRSRRRSRANRSSGFSTDRGATGETRSSTSTSGSGCSRRRLPYWGSERNATSS